MDKHSLNIAVASGKFDREKEYWLNQLSADLLTCNFPTDYPRSGKDQAQHQKIKLIFPDHLAAVIIKMSKASAEGVYLFIVAGLAYLTYKYTRSDQVIIGTPVPRQKDQASYVNQLLTLKIDVDARQSFKEFLLKVRKTVIQANENASFPFFKLLELLEIEQSSSGFPLSDLLVMMENLHDRECIKDVVPPLLCVFRVTDSAILTDWEYDPTLFRSQTIESFFGQLIRFFAAVTADPNLQLTEIELLSAGERKELLHSFNQTDASYPRELTIQQLFERQVIKEGTRAAVVFEEQELTYDQLNIRANQLAWRLRELGVGPETIVALLLERSPEMVISILAVLKAGGAYLPIDPDYPEERISYMLADSGTQFLISRSGLVTGVEFSGQLVEITPELYIGDEGNLPVLNTPDNLAYIIYTSGSTGRPKGCLIEHRNLVRLLVNERIQFDFTSEDVWTLFHSYCFDFSV